MGVVGSGSAAGDPTVHVGAIYVDTVEENAIVALKPKPAFQALLQVATTKEGSGVFLYNEKASTLAEV